jgi:hypothetical protein
MLICIILAAIFAVPATLEVLEANKSDSEKSWLFIEHLFLRLAPVLCPELFMVYLIYQHGKICFNGLQEVILTPDNGQQINP